MTPDADSHSLVGRQIGGYKVLALVGAGGVGEVYRAQDTRLGRDVAIKVLQRDRAGDPTQQARFLREARAASALNHPNILAVYDVGVDDGLPFIVSEFVDGTSLRLAMQRAPLPIQELLGLATQTADGLAAAHEANIVHRDLKPENVMVTRDGRVKILDFGLAKTSTTAAPSDPARPLVTQTETGLIQGTVPYMSPEQARGAQADFRADQFALGLVMYEMATGTQAFRRETPVQTLSAIITDETPSIATLNPRAPAPLRWLIERCLAKDPQQRYAATRDLAQELRTLRDRLTEDTTVRPTDRHESRWRSAAVVLLAVATLATVALVIVWLRPGPAEPDLKRFAVRQPDGATFTQSSAFMAVSPNGRYVAFVASSLQGNDALWLQPLDSLPARQLSGTEGASQPYWSPDSRFIGFASNRRTKKVDVESGVVETLGDAIGSGTWNGDGVIVGPLNHSLSRISASGGGLPTPVTTLDPSRAEIDHRWPYFLPDGRHFLYLATSREPEFDNVLCVGSLDSMEPTILVSPDSKPITADSNAVYVSPGYLIYMRATTLVARAFDASSLRVTGDAEFLAEPVERTSGSQRGAFSVSQTGGVLAYRSFGETELTWVDRRGVQTPIGLPAHYANPALSPNEQSVAVNAIDHETGTSDIWQIDLASGVRSQVTSDPSEDTMPLWSADGKRIFYRSNRRPPPSQPPGPGFYSKAVNGTGREEPLLGAVGPFGTALEWKDGALLYAFSNGPTSPTGMDLWSLPPGVDQKPIAVLSTPANEEQAQISPDGRWIAYVSSEKNLPKNVYVSPYPSGVGPTLVSVNGGIEPKWRADGKELYYLTQDADHALMAVTVRADPTLRIGAPVLLFRTRMSPLLDRGYTRNQYAVTADGQRFLVNQPPATFVPSITVVLNWTTPLKH